MAAEETWYLTREPDRVSLRMSVNTDEACADFFIDVAPGETVCGLTYERWRELPEGAVVLIYENGRPVAVQPAPLAEPPIAR